jgi:hypothetical protein
VQTRSRSAAQVSRRSFLITAAMLAGAPPLLARQNHTRAAAKKPPLIAYVGTFSSPLHDVLPTQVDLPPGNGRGIHLFTVDRASGVMAPCGIFESGASPSCLVLNAAGTRLYSANETDRLGEARDGSISAFAINPTNGQLTLLNTVPSGGAGPTYLSTHPSKKFLLVANYFGGSVAVLPILPDGRLGAASDIKQDAGVIGPKTSKDAPAGSFAFSGHDRTHAHMIMADPSGHFVLHADLGLDQIFIWKFNDRAGVLTPKRSACRLASARLWPAALLLSSQWSVALFPAGGRLEHRSLRLRSHQRAPHLAANHLQPSTRFRR